MRKNPTKRIIYSRILGAFLATYLVLMTGFSIFLIAQERKAQGLELRTYAMQVNNAVEDVLRDYLDSDNRITDMAKVKKEFLRKSSLFNLLGSEVAVFTGDYNLIFSTSGYWLCSYTERTEGGKQYTGYALLNPEDWFSEKEVKEIKNYLYAQPKAKKEGDLAGYSVHLEGLWVDNEMLIPEKINIVAMYARDFDEDGNVTSSGGIHTNEIVYVSGYQNTKNLPYFEHGGIQGAPHPNRNSAPQIELRKVVQDPERLKGSVGMVGTIFSERVNLLSYRYYLPWPYRNTVNMKDEDHPYSEFWTVIAREVNLWDKCAGTLAFVWGSCLITFIIVAMILARQTYNTYRKREELDKKRQEMTNALAHDLKTPLSIISGYAQNLMESIHTEKREHYAGNIQGNVDRMDKIIRQMLDLSRLESDSSQIRFEDVSLGEVCGEIIDRYKHICNEKSITTHLEGEAVAKADRTLIDRVIDNFFVNALESTPDGGIIRITIGSDTLEFFNSGSHIPEEKKEEIWQPYKKADASRGSTKGTGLGLSISSKILQLHKFPHGAENSGDGVVFWFKFA